MKSTKRIADNGRLKDFPSLTPELGRIEKAVIEIEDHGLLTFWLFFDFGGSGQGFGGIALDQWSEKHGRRIGHAAGADLPLQLMQLFGVRRFEAITGRAAYALRDDHGGIVGVALPNFDGGGAFLVYDWRAQWFTKGDDE